MFCTSLYPMLLLLFCGTCMSIPPDYEIPENKPDGGVLDEEEAVLPSSEPEPEEPNLIASTENDEIHRNISVALKHALPFYDYLMPRGCPNVAFAASLGNRGSYGPFSTEVTLVYQDVFVNAGNAYNPQTGIFTAPRNGVYFFTISGHNRSTKPMGLRLVKNGQQMVTVYNYAHCDRYETGTNSISLPLRWRDQVYVRLRKNTWVFDNANDHTTFVGHLLFCQ